MSEVEQNLATILEIESEERVVIEGELVVAEEHAVATVTEDPQPNTNRDVEYDYEYTRNLHRDLLEQGQDALPELLKVAKESQHPRAYEVASGFLKNLSDMADKLMILHEKKKALDGKEGGPGPSQQTVNIDKAVFTGSTADLLKQIKNK
jgi:hypothetical protein